MIHFNKYKLPILLNLENGLINNISKIKKNSFEKTSLKNLELNKIELLNSFLNENPEISYEVFKKNIVEDFFENNLEDKNNYNTNNIILDNQDTINLRFFESLTDYSKTTDTKDRINSNNFNHNFKKTVYLIKYFNLKSEILRFFIFIYFYNYVYQPFDPILFTGSLKNRCNFDMTLLFLYDNYDLNTLFLKI